jgi:hypothetical protein
MAPRKIRLVTSFQEDISLQNKMLYNKSDHPLPHSSPVITVVSLSSAILLSAERYISTTLYSAARHRIKK